MSQRSVLVIGETARDRAAVRRLLSAPGGETYRFGDARSCAAAIRRLQRETWNCVALCEPLGEGSADLHRFLTSDGVAVLIVGATEPLSPNEILSLAGQSEEMRRLKQERDAARAKVAILESLNDAVLVTEASPLCHPGPRVLYANPAFEQMTGYCAAEIVGRTPRMLQGELTDRRKLDRIRAALEKSEPIQLEMTNYRKDGTPFQAEMNILPLKDDEGKAIQFVAIQRDVTQQRRVLSMVQEERDRFEKMVLTSPALFCSLRQRPDGSAHFPFIGSGCRELFGFEQDELKEDATPLFARIFPEDMAQIQPAIAASAETMTAYKVQYRLHHPERGTVWIEVHSMPVAEPEGSILWHGTATDITKRKNAEAMVQRQIEALTKPLAALKSLPKLDQFLEHLLGALTQWLGGASAALWLCEPDQKHLSLVAEFAAGKLQTGQRSRYPSAGQRLPLDVVPYWTSLRDSRQPILVESETMAPPIRDWYIANGIRNLLLAPMRLGEETIGYLSIRNLASHFQKSEMELVQGLAQQATLAVELARLARQEQKAAILQERNRFAQDIHDTLAQGFTGILLQLEAAEYAPEQSLARVHIQKARELAQQSLAEARRSVHALRPQALEALRLAGALADLIGSFSDSRIQALKVLGAERLLPPGIEDRLYRITQEALTNAVRHAGATAIHVELSFEPRDVRLTVRDDGKGFDVKRDSGGNGFGLLGMSERAGEAGGRLAVTTSPGNGTAIEVVAPTKEARREGRNI